MLTPDLQRQWFVYFNEKELGPFAEKDLLAKLASGEFDHTAYVFTEGMSDWALVSDTPVLYKAGPKVESTNAGQWKEQSTQSKVAAQGSQANPFEDLLGANVEQSPKAAAKAPVHQGLSLEGGSGFSQNDKSDVSKSGVSKASPSQSGFTEAKGSTGTHSGIKSAQSMTRLGGGTNAGVVKAPADATVKQNTVSGTAKTKVAPPADAAKKRRLLLFTLLLVIVGAAAYYWQSQMNSPTEGQQANGETATPPDGSEVPPEGTEANVEGAENPPATPTEGVPPGTVAKTPKIPPRTLGGGIAEVDWKKLVEFRGNKDQKGPPYMLAPHPLGDKYPFVMGVLSPLIEAEQVYLAICPDPERSLMAVPKIWYLRTTAIDGFFGVGPLHVEGKELPPGRYKVLVQVPDAFLGETSFEVGTWPDAAKLSEYKSAMDAETKALSSRERDALAAKLKEVKAALTQLKAKSPAAVKGLKGAREWKEFSKAWYESLLKAIRDQKSVTMGPMFFPEAQLKLYNFMEGVRGLQESYTLLSQGGAKLLAKTRNKNIGQEYADLSKQEAAITMDFGNLDKLEAQPLVISAEAVKKGLDYFVSTGASSH